MKRDVMEKWVAALRSGQYSQGRLLLRRTVPGGRNKYCCLGVLQGPVLGLPITPNEMALSDEARRLSGVKTEMGARADGVTLGALNDVYGHSFKEIAEVIEREWEHL